VLHVDVTSLYPSLMVAQRVAPASDDLGVFWRGSMRCAHCAWRQGLARTAADAEERAHQAALAQTFKILINSFYGYLAFTKATSTTSPPDRVTAEGRRIVGQIVDA